MTHDRDEVLAVATTIAAVLGVAAALLALTTIR